MNDFEERLRRALRPANAEERLRRAQRPEDAEERLRRALRPVDAPEGFTDRLMNALPAREPPAVVAVVPPAARPAPRRFWLPAALAASLVASVLLGQHYAQVRDDARVARETEAGLKASRELMQALRVTSQKLDVAYQAVTSPRAADGEENRS